MAIDLDSGEFLNVWGGGQLLAPSGIDGETDFVHGIAARTSPQCCGLEIALPAGEREGVEGAMAGPLLRFADGAPSRCLLGGDFFDLQTERGRTRGAFLDAWHLLLEGPCGRRGADAALRFAERDGRLLVGSAERFDESLLGANLDDAIAARKAWLSEKNLPDAPDAARRTYVKALSIMKTQVLSAQEPIKRAWTTPDRWPHRGMWLWDTAFHAIGFRHIDPALAREMIAAVFDGQQPDGMVPITFGPGVFVNMTQPPILAMAAEEVEAVEPDPAWMEEMYPKFCSYVRWDMENRDTDGAGLVEWHIEGNKDCRSGESGLDNSTRFDCALQLDAPDFNAYIARECEVLARLAERLGRTDEATAWTAEWERICHLMNERLWNEDAGLYLDCNAETGEQTGILSGPGLLPLFCGAASQRQAKRMAAHFEPGGIFDTALPVATIPPALERYYEKDMWRGPAWINLNWMIAEGFERYGFENLAERIREKSCLVIEKYYAQLGSFFEYFDTEDADAPPRLLRKGCCDPSQPYRQAFHDYGWTACLYADLVERHVRG